MQIEKGGAVRCRMSATGILTDLSLARLKPAVGVTIRQAPPRPRGLDECPSCPEYQTHNSSSVRDRQQVIDLPVARGTLVMLPPITFGDTGVGDFTPDTLSHTPYTLTTRRT